MATKPGGRVKSLVAGPLKKELFCGFPKYIYLRLHRNISIARIMFMLYNSIAPKGNIGITLFAIFLSFGLIVYLASILQIFYLLLKTETLAESFMLNGRAFQPS